MSLPFSPPYPPMEARLVDEIPTGAQWQYEPKWDGFRCLVFTLSQPRPGSLPSPRSSRPKQQPVGFPLALS